jgi:hypothetical protein
MAVRYEYSAGRRFVLEQLKEDPGVLLVTSTPAAFHWDPAFDASRIHATTAVRNRAFEGPVRILYSDVRWVRQTKSGDIGNSTFGFLLACTVLRSAACAAWFDASRTRA